jgi:Carboxypeptidase regulatory-like domain
LEVHVTNLAAQVGRFFAVVIFLSCAAAQETRSAIQGRVSDPQNSPVANAIVRVTNVDTNVASPSTTNGTGYYEANLLVAGNYQVSVEAHGFKKSILSGIVLAVGTRTEINVQVELGAVSESISVNAEAPLIDASGTVSTGRVMDTRQVEELPTFNNSALMLIKLIPGMQSGIDRSYNGTNGLGGTSTAHTIGNIGGNEWSLDGAPNMGSGTSASYLPISLAIQEFHVETTQFDASVGHTAGAVISVMTKAGGNAFHGAALYQFWNQRWNGAPFTTKQQYYRNINAAEAAGNHALAQQLRASPMQPSGHNNTYTGTLGGPVIIPKVYNGRNKLFFFVSYDGFNDRKFTRGSVNHTVPTMAERQGDFSDLLKVSASKYQLYDPLSVRPDPPGRATLCETQ